MVDPYCYLADFHVPLLVIRGSNDRYWTADATSLYWDKVPSPKALRILPNEGHDFQNDDAYIKALGHFPRQCLSGEFHAANYSGGSLHLGSGEHIAARRRWRAFSKTLDFRDSNWQVLDDHEKHKAGLNQAHFVEIEMQDGSIFDSPIEIGPRNR
jgi:PhoPQ-activated pathogenicity-related protein